MTGKLRTLLLQALIALALCAFLARYLRSPTPSGFDHLRAQNSSFRRSVQIRHFEPLTNLTRRFERCDWSTADVFDENEPDTCAAKVRYGSMVLCMLKAKPAPEGWVQQSRFTKDSDLKTYGWETKKVATQVLGIGLDDALQGLGVSTASSDWIRVEQNHGGNSEYEETYANYHNSYSPKSGTIIAKFNFGPEWCKANYGLKLLKPMVPMKQWSDVVFQGIKEVTKNLSPKIEHIIRHYIIADAVLADLRSVIESDSLDRTARRWPGYEFDMSTPQAKAVLHTANAKGGAWIIGSHKKELGLKTIDQVKIFECSKSSSRDETWCMYFHVTDVK